MKPKKTRRQRLSGLAYDVTDELFQLAGSEQRASRLALMDHLGCDRGGWGFNPVLLKILAALEKAERIGRRDAAGKRGAK